MSCSPFDLRDYVFGELPAQDARTLESHIAGCTGCREELGRLRLTHSALLAVPDEEIPRRIAFVSDKVFEPGWWQRFWHSGPRLGFASAAMLSLAILTHAVSRPTMQPIGAPAESLIIEARVQAEIAKRLPAALEQVVAQLDARQNRTLVQAVDAAEKRLESERRADLVTVAENFRVLSGKIGRIERNNMASLDLGASQ